MAQCRTSPDRALDPKFGAVPRGWNSRRSRVDGCSTSWIERPVPNRLLSLSWLTIEITEPIGCSVCAQEKRPARPTFPWTIVVRRRSKLVKSENVATGRDAPLARCRPVPPIGPSDQPRYDGRWEGQELFSLAPAAPRRVLSARVGRPRRREPLLPGGCGLHPDHEAVELELREWARSRRLVSPARQTAFDMSSFGTLAALTYPHASAATVRVASRFIGALFALDDLVDHEATKLNVDAMSSIGRHLTGRVGINSPS